MPPVKSEKQRRFMQAAAHDPEVAKRNKIRQSVARQFLKHKKGKVK